MQAQADSQLHSNTIPSNRQKSLWVPKTDQVDRQVSPLTQLLDIFRDRVVQTNDDDENMNFRKVKVLGQGGCGVVWLCERTGDEEVRCPSLLSACRLSRRDGTVLMAFCGSARVPVMVGHLL
jgi:hypothetical protein